MVFMTPLYLTIIAQVSTSSTHLLSIWTKDLRVQDNKSSVRKFKTWTSRLEVCCSTNWETSPSVSNPRPEFILTCVIQYLSYCLYSYLGACQLCVDVGFMRAWLSEYIANTEVRTSILELSIFRYLNGAILLLKKQPFRRGMSRFREPCSMEDLSMYCICRIFVWGNFCDCSFLLHKNNSLHDMLWGVH